MYSEVINERDRKLNLERTIRMMPANNAYYKQFKLKKTAIEIEVFVEDQDAPRHEVNSDSSKAETEKGKIFNKDINDPLFIFPVSFSETSSETVPSVKVSEDVVEAEEEGEPSVMAPTAVIEEPESSSTGTVESEDVEENESDIEEKRELKRKLLGELDHNIQDI